MPWMFSSTHRRQPRPWKTKPETHKYVRPSSTNEEHVVVEKGNEKENDGGGDEGGWSSIYSLSTTPSQTLVRAKSSSPPPPATIFTRRSRKNLAMCTENLGCETGVIYAADDFDAENHCTGRETGGMVGKRRSGKGSMGAGFPPPLTTLSGESRLRILSKRENGRLLLLPVKPSVMEAERTDGRLRLRLYSNKPFHSNDKKVEELEEEEEEVKEEEDMDQEESDEKMMMEEEEVEDGDYLGVVGMEMNEMSYNGINGEEEMGIGNHLSSGGCKEEEDGERRRVTSRGKPMLNWEAEAFWVASS